MNRLAEVLATILESVSKSLSTLNAVSWTEAIRQILLIAVALHWVVMDDKTLLQVVSGVSAICAVFARGATVSNGRVDQKVDEKVAQREMAGTTGTGTALSNGNGRT